jgi:hypothetical protein
MRKQKCKGKRICRIRRLRKWKRKWKLEMEMEMDE